MCVGSNLAVQGNIYIPLNDKMTKGANNLTEMKLVAAVIYSNFRTSIVDDDGIEAIDAYTVKPKGDKLILRFEHL